MSPWRSAGIPYLSPCLQYGNSVLQGHQQGGRDVPLGQRQERDQHREDGIGFAAAALLFEGLTVEVPDTRHAYGETRINAFGYINGRLFVACYTPRCGWRHLISTRKANSREVKRYG